ncbi:MAG TPA: nuclear transport factor 2 family protein [Acidimicrobiia bacterium]|nr:nuclear transport factor 2 family protein [Acidimicrobiia bacterium]
MRERLRSIVVLVMILTPACSGDDGARTTPPVAIDAAELETISSHVSGVVLGHGDAWARADVDAILAFWDDETIHEDTGFNQLLTGEALFAMPDGFDADYPDFRWDHVDLFVSRDAAIDVTAGWGVTLKGIEFTEAEAMGEIDRIEVDADGTIGRWTIFYDLATWEVWRSPPFRLEDALRVIGSYEEAWESGDVEAVRSLYASDAERRDTLLGTGGSVDDAARFAAAFFEAYPAASLQPGVAFADSRQTSARPGERVGSVFEIGLGPDESCSLRMAVLFELDGDAITAEEVFWDPDSLVECGWAE